MFFDGVLWIFSPLPVNHNGEVTRVLRSLKVNVWLELDGTFAAIYRKSFNQLDINQNKSIYFRNSPIVLQSNPWKLFRETFFAGGTVLLI